MHLISQNSTQLGDSKHRKSAHSLLKSITKQVRITYKHLEMQKQCSTHHKSQQSLPCIDHSLGHKSSTKTGYKKSSSKIDLGLLYPLLTYMVVSSNPNRLDTKWKLYAPDLTRLIQRYHYKEFAKLLTPT